MDKSAAACVAGLLFFVWPVLAERTLQWDTATPNQLALRCDGADVWRFRFDPAQGTKPYFDPVCVAGGPSLTWARPPDHVWHYALWFSWKHINGVNYWEERGGKSQGETFWSAPEVATKPDGSAVIVVDFGYRPGATNEPVLKERRTVALSAPDASGAYHMDWTQVFTAGGRPVTLDAPGGYSGLSVRFAPAFTNVETVVSTVGRVPDANNRLEASGAGADQSGTVDGKPYGIAMLVHPDNPRAPGDWFSVDRPKVPFHYLNAAFPMRGVQALQPGGTLTLRYRVHVHAGRWDAEALRDAAARYAGDVAAGGKIRVLLLTGANNHDWRATTAALATLFAASPKFAVTVEECPWKMKPADIEGYDLLFSNWNTYGPDKREWTAEMKAAFMAWVKRGGGFFVLHAGGSMFYDWDAFQSLTGGSWEKGTFHPHRQAFTVNIADKAHPVTRGLADFEIFDEPWQKVANRNPARRVLATATIGTANKGSGEPEPFVWTTEMGQGRCFNLVPGHDVRALEAPGCAALILRGSAWAATGDVR